MAEQPGRTGKSASKVYAALALAFHKPGEHLYDPEYVRGLKRSLSRTAPDLVPLADAMADGLAATPDPVALMNQYCKLFFGPGHIPAAPYESIYIGGGAIMTETTLAVANFYHEAGVQLWEGFRDMPDHLAAELEFLFYVSQCEANHRSRKREQAAETWAARRRKFLAEHLGKWIGTFRDRVAEHDSAGFYRAAAELAAACVKRDR